MKVAPEFSSNVFNAMSVHIIQGSCLPPPWSLLLILQRLRMFIVNRRMELLILAKIVLSVLKIAQEVSAANEYARCALYSGGAELIQLSTSAISAVFSLQNVYG